MSDRANRLGFVTLTIDVPIEIAEYLNDHGQTLLDELRFTVVRYRRDEQNLIRERDRKHQTVEQERADHRIRLTRIGRLAYRVYRNSLRDHEAKNVRRLTPKSKIAWKRAFFKGFADEHCIDFHVAEFAFTRFKRDLDQRSKAWRNRNIFRRYFEGQSNSEIAARFGLSIPSIKNLISRNSNALDRYRAEHVEANSGVPGRRTGSIQRQVERKPAKAGTASRRRNAQ